MADLSKLRFNGTDYNVKDASAPLRKFTNYSKTGNLPITSNDTTQTAIGKLEKALDSKINTSAKGTASGVAELDANGKVPSSQLPSYVDDVLEYSAKRSFPATGETGKIYVDTTTNKTYRWSGSAYVEISESLALGETSSTAYRGDRGKAAYDHSQITNGNPHGTTGANTNLTGYSKGSSKDAVAATDTVNAAIAKHENRINANQTNILYGLNTGVKNLLTIKSTVTANGLTSVQQSDGYTVKITGTPTGGKSIQWSEVIKITESGTYKIKLTLSGTMASCYLYDISTSALVHEYYSSNTYEETLTANHEYAMYTYSQSAIDATISAMLCTAAAYAQSSDYIAPALPNYDLTRLQAEDRAALAEEIDAGAKNKWDFANATFIQYNNSTYTKTSDSITVTSTGTGTWAFASYALPVLSAGKYVISFTVSNLSGNTARLLISSSSQAAQGSYYESILIPCNGNYNLEFTSTGSQLYVLFYPNYSGTASTTAKYTASNIMVATKAAFGVSPKFVPYRMSYQDLCDKKDAALSTTSKTSGSLDDIAENSFYFVSDGTTGRPVSEYGFVKTSVYSSSVMLQEFTSFSGNAANSGLVFVRVKQAGTWQSWKQLTNA